MATASESGIIISQNPTDNRFSNVMAYSPPGWIKARIGDLIHKLQTANPAFSGPGNFKYVDIEAVDNVAQRIVAPKTLPRATPPSRARHVIRAGDVIISLVRPRLKNIAIVPEELDAQWASTAFCVCRPHLGIDTRYLYYLFTQDEFVGAIKTYGDSPPSGHDDDFLNTEIPIPPSAEQSRIADRIDELFTDLSAGVSALQRVKKKLKRYRSAVLHAAITGRLLPSKRGEWADLAKWRPLGSLIGDIEQGWSPKCERESVSDDAEWAVMTTTAIQKMAFDGRENKRLPTTLKPTPQYEVNVGDLLITRAGPRSRCGITCLVRKTRSRLILCDKAYRFRCIESEAHPEYIELALNARPITDAIERMKTGSSDSGLNLTQSRFRSLLVPVPSKAEQVAIVEAVNENLSQIDAMEAEVERGLTRAARLRQAILKAAFAGKLASQDPTDEPATKLLERLKAAKAIAESVCPSPAKRRKKVHEPVGQ